MTHFTIAGYSWWLWLLPRFWRAVVLKKHPISPPKDTQGVWRRAAHDKAQTIEDLLVTYSQGTVIYEYLFRKVFVELGCRSLCDAGCGKGYWMKYISENMYRIRGDIGLAGFDCNEERLKLLNTFLDQSRMRIDVRNEDIFKGVSFSDDAFDAVTCLAFLPCFNNQEIGMVLSELVRVTRKYIIIYEDTRHVQGRCTNFGRPDIMCYFRHLPVKSVFQRRVAAPFMHPSEIQYFEGWYGFPKRMVTIVQKI